jgi:hypothetical protein
MGTDMPWVHSSFMVQECLAMAQLGQLSHHGSRMRENSHLT